MASNLTILYLLFIEYLCIAGAIFYSLVFLHHMTNPEYFKKKFSKHASVPSINSTTHQHDYNILISVVVCAILFTLVSRFLRKKGEQMIQHQEYLKLQHIEIEMSDIQHVATQSSESSPKQSTDEKAIYLSGFKLIDMK